MDPGTGKIALVQKAREREGEGEDKRERDGQTEWLPLIISILFSKRIYFSFFHLHMHGINFEHFIALPVYCFSLALDAFFQVSFNWRLLFTRMEMRFRCGFYFRVLEEQQSTERIRESERVSEWAKSIGRRKLGKARKRQTAEANNIERGPGFGVIITESGLQHPFAMFDRCVDYFFSIFFVPWTRALMRFGHIAAIRIRPRPSDVALLL